MDPLFMVMLQNSRDYFKRPMVVTSGWRCREYQMELNPATPDSSHTRGMGADIAVHSNKERYDMLLAFIQAGFNRIGIYDKHFHVDTDPDLPPGVVWVGDSK